MRDKYREKRRSAGQSLLDIGNYISVIHDYKRDVVVVLQDIEKDRMLAQRVAAYLETVALS